MKPAWLAYDDYRKWMERSAVTSRCKKYCRPIPVGLRGISNGLVIDFKRYSMSRPEKNIQTCPGPRAVLLLQFFIEKINGTFPGKFCCRFIVSWRGIIMKAMVHVRIYVDRILFLLLL